MEIALPAEKEGIWYRCETCRIPEMKLLAVGNAVPDMGGIATPFSQ